MDKGEKLSIYRNLINEALSTFFNEHERAALDFDNVSEEAFGFLRGFTLGSGKRLRAILMILGYECCGGQDLTTIVKASCALEFMQSYLLIHDDVMDRSQLRRGSPTIHRLYEVQYKDRVSDPFHFSLSMAILVGNIANHFGALSISESGFPSDRTSTALAEYNCIAIDVTYGQLLDMSLPWRSEVTYEDLSKVQNAKTSRYSTEGPLRMGGILARASFSQLDTLTRFASPLGRAFQIKDDLLGMFGSEDKIGKSATSDLSEGKKTLLILKALERSSDVQREIIQKNLGKQSISDADLYEVRKVIEETGSRNYSELEMTRLVDEAKNILKDSEFDLDVKELLLRLADYLILREK